MKKKLKIGDWVIWKPPFQDSPMKARIESKEGSNIGIRTSDTLMFYLVKRSEIFF